MEIDEIFEKFAKCDAVEAIALGGSRATGVYDEKSDYDVYVYLTGEFPEDKRREILAEYTCETEIGNHYWEYEDNCILNNGVGLDIIYRRTGDFEKYMSYVVEQGYANNGYTTCFWHNLVTSKIIFDRNGKFAEYQKRFTVPYPKKLKENIIDKNMKLLSGVLPSYDMQIKKAVNRGDLVSVNHRTAEFLSSYFDVIFALNEKTHPGEKRLVEQCLKTCEILPEDFEENFDRLFKEMFCGDIMPVINDMAQKLQKTVQDNL